MYSIKVGSHLSKLPEKMKCPLVLCVLFIVCSFEVKGDVSKLKIFANYVSQKFLSYDQEFFNSLILTLSNMKDQSTYSLIGTWNSTHSLFNNIDKLAETNEQRECVISERRKLSVIIDEVATSLFQCGRHALKFGSPIRNEVQKLHKTSMKIIHDLQLMEDGCLEARYKREIDCNPVRVEELETLLNALLQQLITLQIEGDTIKLAVLSDTLECNAKVLTGVYNEVTNMQERLKECIPKT